MGWDFKRLLETLTLFSSIILAFQYAKRLVSKVKQCLVHPALTKEVAVTLETKAELKLVRRPDCCQDLDLDIKTLNNLKMTNWNSF